MEQISWFLLRVPVILIALTIHEYAHGYLAWLKGDNTAKKAGRLTLNPIAHLDIFGTIMLFFGPFGWAKPVPINHFNFRNPQRDTIYVGAAGPLANIALAIIFGFILRFIREANIVSQIPFFILSFLQLSFYINLGISFFNLIPVPPLDGSHILMGFLPPEKLRTYLKYMHYAPMVLFSLIILEWLAHIPIFSTIIDPLWKPYLAFWQFIVFGHRIM
jgi:Zn-dependent protease